MTLKTNIAPLFVVSLLCGAATPAAAFQAPALVMDHARSSVEIILVGDKKPTFTEEEQDAIDTYRRILKEDPDNKQLNDAGITTDSTDQEIVDTYHKKSKG